MRYYFIGICGTAMASLAVLLKQKGHEVWGSDQNIYPPMSDFLVQNNIPVRVGYDVKHLEQPADRIIIGNALSRGNPEVEAILNRRLPFSSLPEVIRQEFAQPLKSVVITGTHGKTTTTSLMSWVLETAGLSPTFLIGGIARNFDASARIGSGDYFIVEGDEYDSAFFDKRPKFLHYLPHYLIVNNIEFDHADIYRDVAQIKDGFRKLLRTVASEGLILANGDDPHVRDVTSPVYSRIRFFGKGAQADLRFSNVNVSENGTSFRVHKDGEPWNVFRIPLFGEYQLYNTLAVIGIADDLGLAPQQIQAGLDSFLNVKRRLERWGDFNGAPFYDDFAHHPTAIRETLDAVRQKHPSKRVIAVFEPRTNTTVKNIFQKELADALANADVIFIAPIYRPERIPENERLSLEELQDHLRRKNRDVHLLKDYSSIQEELTSIVAAQDVVILMTNGDLGGEYAGLRASIQRPGKENGMSVPAK